MPRVDVTVHLDAELRRAIEDMRRRIDEALRTEVRRSFEPGNDYEPFSSGDGAARSTDDLEVYAAYGLYSTSPLGLVPQWATTGTMRASRRRTAEQVVAEARAKEAQRPQEARTFRRAIRIREEE